MKSPVQTKYLLRATCSSDDTTEAQKETVKMMHQHDKMCINAWFGLSLKGMDDLDNESHLQVDDNVLILQR